MWHKIAPRLSEEFTVIAPDLRGYGDSSKPITTPDHEPYSKRAVARDHVAVMRYFGFEHFFVAGHDRGAYGAYRLALDHPERVDRLAILDIIPAGEAWCRADQRFMRKWWHWAFLAQPAPLPETLSTPNPEAYYFRKGRERFDPEALADPCAPCTIRRRSTRCARITALTPLMTACSTRPTAPPGGKMRCPVLVLWGRQDDLEELYGDPLTVWRDWADDVRGRGLNCGHYLAEEAPDETSTELRDFFRSAE